MRIIAGAARGTRLKAPEGSVTRPIPDRLKGSLFNILYSRAMQRGISWCDLFSGVGSIGLEALSRGAAYCVFVESDRRVFRFLMGNIEKTRMGDRCDPYRADAETAVKRLLHRGKKFDIVMLDPPFAMSREWLQVQHPTEEIVRVGRADPYVGLEHFDELELVRNDKGEWVPDENLPEVIEARRRAGESLGIMYPAGEKFTRIFNAALELLTPQGLLIIRGERLRVEPLPPEGYSLETRLYGRQALYFLSIKMES